MDDRVRVTCDVDLRCERRDVRAFFEDGSLEGQTHWVDERHLTTGRDMAFMPPASLLGPDESLCRWWLERYTIREHVQKITNVHCRRVFVASCGNRYGLTYDTDEKFGEFLRSAPIEIVPPSGGRNFEAWWAMRMIEIAQPQLSYTAMLWERELSFYDKNFLGYVRCSYEERALRRLNAPTRCDSRP